MNKIHNNSENLYSIKTDADEVLIRCIEASLRCKTPLWAVPEGFTTKHVRDCFNIVMEKLSQQSLCSYTFYSGLIDETSPVNSLPKEIVQHIFGFATPYLRISFRAFTKKHFTNGVTRSLLAADQDSERERIRRDLERAKEIAEEKQFAINILPIDDASPLEEKWSLKSLLPRKRFF